MKKIILSVALTSVTLLASDTTIKATMKMMGQGVEQIQKGFLYNSKKDILQGIAIVKNSNTIFKTVDVSTFIPHNQKVRVTQNITQNLENDLKTFEKMVKNSKFTTAPQSYGKVLNDCVACHTVIRGW